MEPLEWDEKLVLASKEHVLDSDTNSIVGHKGSDGSSPGSRC